MKDGPKKWSANWAWNQPFARAEDQKQRILVPDTFSSSRKQWIRDRLEELAGIFGIDIMGFAVLSNHLHVVVRTRPDVVNDWSDDEVALRWWRLFPQCRNADWTPAEPSEFELNLIRNDKTGLAEKRKRLSEISWFSDLDTQVM